MSDPLTYLSVCSGIEAASVAASKSCSHCGAVKPLSDFHASAKGKMKRASWCKTCANGIARERHKREYTPENKRRWQIKSRYGITCDQFDTILSAQKGKCGICSVELVKPHIDHDHMTGVVRGLLCHRCNIVIGGFDDPDFRMKATAWLERGAK
jgi:hypothetical protein